LLRRVIANSALVVVAIIVGIAVVELGLRSLGMSYPEFYTYDSNIGPVHIPNMQGWQTIEGHAYVSINSDGLRDREHTIEKPKDVIRIAVLGDSYTEALQVPVEDAFWSVMERRLGTCSRLHGRRVEAMNFGVAGYGTAQEYLTLKYRVWKYAPDVILLAFLTSNDISDNSQALKKARTAYFVLKNDSLVLDNRLLEKQVAQRQTLVDRARKVLFSYSRILQLVHYLQRTYRRQVDQAPAADGNLPGQEAGVNDAVYREPNDPPWREAWRVTEALVSAVHQEVVSHGAQFLLVTLSNGIQDDADAEKRRRYMQQIGVSDLLYPDRRMEALAKREGIPFLMLAPRLQSWAEANKVCVHGFGNAIPCGGHWNETGHRLAGDMIAAWMCDALAQASSMGSP
jgi:hypothetical protein